MKKREHLHTVGGNGNWCSHCGKQYGGSSKIKNIATIGSSNFTLGYISKKIENTNSKTYMHPNVPSNISHNGQYTE